VREKRRAERCLKRLLAADTLEQLFQGSLEERSLTFRILADLSSGGKQFREIAERVADRAGVSYGYLVDRVMVFLASVGELRRRDLFLRLGVHPGASYEEIRRRWRQLVKQLHPDAGGQGAEAFLEVRSAYETLSDAKLRARYDAYWATQLAPLVEAAALAGEEGARRQLLARLRRAASWLSQGKRVAEEAAARVASFLLGKLHNVNLATVVSFRRWKDSFLAASAGLLWRLRASKPAVMRFGARRELAGGLLAFLFASLLAYSSSRYLGSRGKQQPEVSVPAPKVAVRKPPEPVSQVARSDVGAFWKAVPSQLFPSSVPGPAGKKRKSAAKKGKASVLASGQKRLAAKEARRPRHRAGLESSAPSVAAGTRKARRRKAAVRLGLSSASSKRRIVRAKKPKKGTKRGQTKAATALSRSRLVASTTWRPQAITRSEALDFLQRFRKTYERLDADALASLFTEAASENERAGREAISAAYRAAFAKLWRARYWLGKPKVTALGLWADVSAPFVISFQDRAGRYGELRGEAKWWLVKEGGKLKVLRLQYALASEKPR